MPAIRDWDKFIDRLLKNNQEAGKPRSMNTQDCINKVVMRMERYQQELNIPDSSIKIVSYFAKNRDAVIIPDANVRRAFFHARRAMNL